MLDSAAEEEFLVPLEPLLRTRRADLTRVAVWMLTVERCIALVTQKVDRVVTRLDTVFPLAVNDIGAEGDGSAAMLA